MKLKDRIIKNLPTYSSKFSAIDVARDEGLTLTRAFYETSPYTTKILLELCKEGYLYQWVKGVGSKHDLSDSAPSWEMWYVKRNSDLANTLIKVRGVDGYKIK